MKKLLFVTSLLFFGYLTAKAQNTSGIIKVNPIGLAYSINVSYEHPITDNGSVMGRFRYYHSPLEYEIGSSKLTIPSNSISLKAGYRFYPSNNNYAPEGFYISPTGIVLSDFNETVFGAGGHAGYQWVWYSGFSLDIYGGVDVLLLSEAFLLPVMGTSLGYAF